MVFLPIKSLPNLLFGVCSASQEIRVNRFAQPTINPLTCCICWTGLLGRAVFPPWNEGPNFGSYKHHSSNASILQCSGFFIVQPSHPYMTAGKNIALIRQIFVGNVMSLLFNMLSRLVITFLPRSKSLLISSLQSPSAVILEPKKIKSVTFHYFPIYLS